MTFQELLCRMNEKGPTLGVGFVSRFRQEGLGHLRRFIAYVQEMADKCGPCFSESRLSWRAEGVNPVRVLGVAVILRDNRHRVINVPKMLTPACGSRA
jgi:hypothetical protein